MANIVPQTVFTKTAKGILEIRNKSTKLPRDLATVLERVDGALSVADMQPRSGMTPPQLQHALTTLVTDGYIKAVSLAPPSAPDTVEFESPAVATRLTMEAAAHALESSEATRLAQQESRAALEARLRAEAEGRARALAESRANAEGEARANAEAAARTAALARERAEQEAAAISEPAARAEAEARARSAATAALRARAEAQARAEAEARARALVEEKRSAELEAQEQAHIHEQAEQRAKERAAAATHARDALQAQLEAQLEAAAAVCTQGDAAARAQLLIREEAAERARAEAQAVARSQGIAKEEPSADLHFDDLAQKLTARVHAERRAREDADRKSRAGLNPDGSEAPRTDGGPAFPHLGLVPDNAAPAPAKPAVASPGGDALPAINVAATTGRGDIKHVTPEHVPSALERAMMERAARTEADALKNGIAASAQPAASAAAPAGPSNAPRAAAPKTTPAAAAGNRRRESAAPETAPPPASHAAPKVIPTLDQDEPLHERLNIDRAAHDMLVESAAERRNAEIASLSRHAADMRRQRQVEEARRAASAQREKKRRSGGRALAIAFVAVPALTIAWLQFVPLNGYIPDAQHALAARLNQPTTISTLRYVLLPSPRIVLEGVRIGAAQAIHVDRVDAHAWPAALISGPIAFDTVEASGVTIDPGMLATIPSWTGGRGATTAHASRLRLSNVKLGLAEAKMEPLNGEIAFAANGTVRQATLANEKINLDIVPQPNGGVRIALNATDWRVPFGPAVTFSYLTAAGIADKQHFATTELSGRIGGGAVSGTLAARWDGPTIAGGELKLQGVRIDEAAQELAPNLRAKGILTANLRYAMQADSASGLMEKPLVDGTFTITRGEFPGIDLARAVQSPGSVTRGRTAFDELKGSVQISNNTYSYRNLQLASGPLEATGHVEVTRGGQLSGRISAAIRSGSSVAARANFVLSGTVKEPQLVR